MVPREKWIDERLDDLNKKVDDGFARLDAQIARLDGDIKELRRDMNSQFKTLHQSQIAGVIAIVAAILGSNAL